MQARTLWRCCLWQQKRGEMFRNRKEKENGKCLLLILPKKEEHFKKTY
jgi:hypothetical protein